jgi:hypothetical protein
MRSYSFCLLMVSFVINSTLFAENRSQHTEDEPGPQKQSLVKSIRYFKTVMPNVLYRGGAGGGRKPLTNDELTLLCQAGFSEAVYLYPNGYKPKTIQCKTNDGRENQIKYSQYKFRPHEDKRKFIELIYNVMAEKKGPVFVHCWNGWHATGELAAISLMQFCDYSGKKAGQYWKDNVGDNGNKPAYQNIINKHIGQFPVVPSLSINEATKHLVCPQ